MQTRKRKGGRPQSRKPKPGDRVPLGLRVTPATKEALDRAAEISGRSQSQEAELRLENSFRDGQMLEAAMSMAYGEETEAVLEIFAELIRIVQSWQSQVAIFNPSASAIWRTDPFWFDQTVVGLNEILKRLRPPGEPTAPVFGLPLEDVGRSNADRIWRLLLGDDETNDVLAKSGWASKIRAKLGLGDKS